MSCTPTSSSTMRSSRRLRREYSNDPVDNWIVPPISKVRPLLWPSSRSSAATANRSPLWLPSTSTIRSSCPALSRHAIPLRGGITVLCHPLVTTLPRLEPPADDRELAGVWQRHAWCLERLGCTGQFVRLGGAAGLRPGLACAQFAPAR